MVDTLAASVTVALVLVSTWTGICHFLWGVHYVVDEVVLDVLILGDVGLQVYRQGVYRYLDRPWNWINLLTIWLCVLYWVLYSVLPAFDWIENSFVWIRYTASCVRLHYSWTTMCKMRRFDQYEPIAEDPETFEREWVPWPLVAPHVDWIETHVHVNFHHALRAFSSPTDGSSLRPLALALRHNHGRMLWILCDDAHVYGLWTTTPWTPGATTSLVPAKVFHLGPDGVRIRSDDQASMTLTSQECRLTSKGASWALNATLTEVAHEQGGATTRRKVVQVDVVGYYP